MNGGKSEKGKRSEKARNEIIDAKYGNFVHFYFGSLSEIIFFFSFSFARSPAAVRFVLDAAIFRLDSQPLEPALTYKINSADGIAIGEREAKLPTNGRGSDSVMAEVLQREKLTLGIGLKSVFQIR